MAAGRDGSSAGGFEPGRGQPGPASRHDIDLAAIEVDDDAAVADVAPPAQPDSFRSASTNMHAGVRAEAP